MSPISPMPWTHAAGASTWCWTHGPISVATANCRFRWPIITTRPRSFVSLPRQRRWALAPGFYFFGRDRQGELSVGNPQTKIVANANWALRPLSVNLSVTRYGGYTYQRSQTVAQDFYYGAKYITDLEVGVDVTRYAKLSVGASNLFNVRPDTNFAAADPNTGTAAAVYGPSPYSPAGGFYYACIAAQFCCSAGASGDGPLLQAGQSHFPARRYHQYRRAPLL
jgi:iron complex outermembrane receptor protein